MQDNGLLKYYREKANDSGCLKLDEIDCHQYHFASLMHCIDGRDYFVKKSSPFYVSAEVLLSQIYFLAGVPTAIYMPAVKCGQVVAVSNDVVKPNSIKAKDFFNHIKDKNPNTHDFAALSHFKNSQMVDYSKYFTNQSLRELILMQALDTATFNTDRHMLNYFAEVNDPCGDVKATHFVSFDYGASAFSSERELEHIMFFNTFGTPKMNDNKVAGLKSKEEMINCFRENETINSYMPRQEIAQVLSSIDVVGIAKDITEQTGFEVDKLYVNNIEKSLYQTAEQIGQ